MTSTFRRLVGSGVVTLTLTLTVGAHPGRGAAQQGQPATSGRPAVQRVHVRGVDLFYVEQGRGEPVLLLHGFLHDYRVWTSELAALSSGYRAIALSRRYRWPGKPPAGSYELTPESDLADLLAFIDALGLGQAHLVGHSSGANLALGVVRTRPDAVRSVVLAEPGLPALITGRRDAPPPLSPELRDRVRQAYERGERERTLELIRNAVLGPDARPAVSSAHPHAGQIALDNLWQVEQWWKDVPAERPFTCEDARAVKLPVLLIGGERSPAFFRVSLDEMQKCLPGAQRVVLPGASHGLQLENPEAFDRTLLGFLARQAR